MKRFFAMIVAFGLAAAATEVTAQDEPAKEEGPAKKAPDEAELKTRVAETRKKLAEVRGKIESDHKQSENSAQEMEKSEARIAELKAALENEKVRHKQLVDGVARIEREHNGDHDAEENLQRELAGREKDLAEFASKQDEITRLEKRAAELRGEAAKLRKRAEELKKK